MLCLFDHRVSLTHTQTTTTCHTQIFKALLRQSLICRCSGWVPRGTGPLCQLAPGRPRSERRPRSPSERLLCRPGWHRGHPCVLSVAGSRAGSLVRCSRRVRGPHHPGCCIFWVVPGGGTRGHLRGHFRIGVDHLRGLRLSFSSRRGRHARGSGLLSRGARRWARVHCFRTGGGPRCCNVGGGVQVCRGILGRRVARRCTAEDGAPELGVQGSLFSVAPLGTADCSNLGGGHRRWAAAPCCSIVFHHHTSLVHSSCLAYQSAYGAAGRDHRGLHHNLRRAVALRGLFLSWVRLVASPTPSWSLRSIVDEVAFHRRKEAFYHHHTDRVDDHTSHASMDGHEVLPLLVVVSLEVTDNRVYHTIGHTICQRCSLVVACSDGSHLYF